MSVFFQQAKNGLIEAPELSGNNNEVERIKQKNGLLAKSPAFEFSIAVMRCFSCFCEAETDVKSFVLIEEALEMFAKSVQLKCFEVAVEINNGLNSLLVNLENLQNEEFELLRNLSNALIPILLNAVEVIGFPKCVAYLGTIEKYGKYVTDEDLKVLINEEVRKIGANLSKSLSFKRLSSLIDHKIASLEVVDYMQNFIFKGLKTKKADKKQFYLLLSIFLKNNNSFILQNYNKTTQILSENKKFRQCLRGKLKCYEYVLTAIFVEDNTKFKKALDTFLIDCFVALKERNAKIRKSGEDFIAFITKTFRVNFIDLFQICYKTMEDKKMASKSGALDALSLLFSNFSFALSSIQKQNVFDMVTSILLQPNEQIEQNSLQDSKPFQKSPSMSLIALRKDEKKSLLGFIKTFVSILKREELSPTLPKLFSMISQDFRPQKHKTDGISKDLLKPNAKTQLDLLKRTKASSGRISKENRAVSDKTIKNTKQNLFFREKVKVIIEKLIKKFSVDVVKEFLPLDMTNLVKSANSRINRSKRTDKDRRRSKKQIGNEFLEENIKDRKLGNYIENKEQNAFSSRKKGENVENKKPNESKETNEMTKFYDGLFEDKSGKIIIKGKSPEKEIVEGENKRRFKKDFREKDYKRNSVFKKPDLNRRNRKFADRGNNNKSAFIPFDVKTLGKKVRRRGYK